MVRLWDSQIGANKDVGWCGQQDDESVEVRD